jgi:cytochrome P450
MTSATSKTHRTLPRPPTKSSPPPPSTPETPPSPNAPPDFITSCKASHDFIDHFVRLALSKAKNKTKPEASKHVFLESLAAETQDPIELRSQSLHILLAGRDTTASLLSWLFFSLARSPAHYAKLHAVVLEQFGTYDVPMNITFASLKGCKYL